MAEQTDLKQDDDSLDLLISSTAESPAPVKKVELDLDDAPFLQADEKEPAATHEVAVPDANAEDLEKARRKKKMLLILAAGGGIILVLAAAAIWWFFFRTPPPAGPEPLKPEVVVVPKAAVETGPSEIAREFAPFIVPIKIGQGQQNFLVCKFTTITKEPGLNSEIDQQRVALRDAIYYYLRSKDNSFLTDARNATQIKKDLLSIFNDYLTKGKLEDILFESYLSH